MRLTLTLVALAAAAHAAPRIQVTPATQFFGVVGVGRTASATIIITNVGDADLHVSAVTLGGADPGQFAVDDKAALGAVAPGASRAFAATFAPTALGAFSATVTIASDDPMEPARAVALTGTGGAAKLSVVPASIDFGWSLVGAPSLQREVVVTNSGEADADVTGVSFAGPQAAAFAAVGATAGKVAARGGTFTLTLAVTPAFMGPHAATVTIAFDEPMMPTATVSLACIGAAGVVSLNQPFVDFGVVPPNPNPPPVKMVTITNTGNWDLLLTNALIDDPQMTNVFDSQKVNQLQNNMGLPVTIKPDASYSFDVTFSPWAEGQYQAALALDFDGDPKVKHLRVPLAGVGSTSRLVVSPAAIQFPSTHIGSFSDPETLTLTNTGAFALDVQSIVLGGASPPAFHVDWMGPFAIGAGKAVAISVIFQPLAGGAASATLTITAAGLAPINVKLTGTGTQFLGAAAPPVIDFGMVAVGSRSDPVRVGMRNGGTFSIDIDRIRATDPAFLVDGKLGPFEPGETRVFALTFAPTKVGPQSALFEVFARDREGPIHTVPLHGVGVPRPITDPPAAGCGCGVGRARGVPALAGLLLGVCALAIRRRARRTN